MVFIDSYLEYLSSKRCSRVQGVVVKCFYRVHSPGRVAGAVRDGTELVPMASTSSQDACPYGSG